MSQDGEDRWWDYGGDSYEDSDDESRSPMEEGHEEGDDYSINEHEAMNIRGGTTRGRRGQQYPQNLNADFCCCICSATGGYRG